MNLAGSAKRPILQGGTYLHLDPPAQRQENHPIQPGSSYLLNWEGGFLPVFLIRPSFNHSLRTDSNTGLEAGLRFASLISSR